MSRAARLERQEFLDIVKSEKEVLDKNWKLLSEVCSLLNRSPDATRTVLEDMNRLLDSLPDLTKSLRSTRDAMRLRGATLHADEAKAFRAATRSSSK